MSTSGGSRVEALSGISIRALMSGSPELLTAAQWRHDAFLNKDGYALADSIQQLEKLVTDPQGCETALIAFENKTPIGICLLVLHELPPAHDLSPWLASLYVAPEHRGKGVARALIAAIESHAQACGVARLHLYTGESEELYARCGWQVAERMQSRFGPFVLMVRDLQ